MQPAIWATALTVQEEGQDHWDSSREHFVFFSVEKENQFLERMRSRSFSKCDVRSAASYIKQKDLIFDKKFPMARLRPFLWIMNSTINWQMNCALFIYLFRFDKCAYVQA